MRRWLMPCLALVTLVACTSGGTSISGQTAQFWRPISEPNLQMSLDKAQKKLDFDLSQCRCSVYPANMSRTDAVEFQPDRQRLAQTSVTITPDEDGDCVQQPSLIVSECMRGRGWEVTNCSGRMPLPGGGSLCAGYVVTQ
ncbi:MAG: hypothetical protein SFW62_01830 [Alphaproteobacteria bacterium]|nr:hypothetical protein [Alphaproteobacteria bacterium]